MNEFVFNPKYPNEITATRKNIDLSIKRLSRAPSAGPSDPLPELSAEEREKYNKELKASLSRALTDLSRSFHEKFDWSEIDSLRR